MLEASIKNLDILVGILVAASTAAFGFFRFSQTRREEFKKEFWKKRYENYEIVLELASKISVAKDLSLVQDDIQKFREYYWGKLAMIEDQQVLHAMVIFENTLSDAEQNLQKNAGALKKYCYRLAQACRSSLRDTWEPVKLYDLKREER
jgi:hypothetical protein